MGGNKLNQRETGNEILDYEIKNFIKHEKYRTAANGYDIALIELNRNVKFSLNLRPACLSQLEFGVGNVIAVRFCAIL